MQPFLKEVQNGFTPLAQQLSSLEQTLEEIRSASAPKTRFTFKRKADKPVLAAAQTPLPSSSGRDELEEKNGVVGTSTVHKLSSHSNCRLFLRSIPTLGAGPQSSDLTISDLDRCIVDLCGAADTMPHQNQLCLTALHVRNLKDTLLILPNVEGSVLLHHLYRCTVIVGCHQASILPLGWQPTQAYSCSSVCTTRSTFEYTSLRSQIRSSKTALLSRLQSIHRFSLNATRPSMCQYHPT